MTLQLFCDVTVESAEMENEGKPEPSRFKHSTAFARIGCGKRLGKALNVLSFIFETFGKTAFGNSPRKTYKIK